MRLPGTYASDYQGGASWQRGRSLVVGVFLLNTACYLFVGAVGLWTGDVQALTFYSVFLTAHTVLFFTFWAGVTWTRWPYAALQFWAAVYVLLWTFVFYAALPGWFRIVQVLQGALSLGLTYFFAFSADLTVFLHRQQERRTWGRLLPLALVLGAYFASALGCWGTYRAWLDQRQRDLVTYAEGIFSEVGLGWDAPEVEQQMDPDLRRKWPAASRREQLQPLARALGRQQRVHSEQAQVSCRFEAPAGLVSRGVYQAAAEFERGEAVYVVHTASNGPEPWRITGLFLEHWATFPSTSPDRPPAPHR